MSIGDLKDLRKLMSELEDERAFRDFSNRLKKERSDRTIILMCASFLDAGLKGGILLHLPNQEAALSLFEQNGPLHSLGDKIKMAEAMELFGPDTKKNLIIIQTVRNAFAHSLLVRSFKTPAVLKACNALTLPFGGEGMAFWESGKIKFKTPKQKFVSVSFMTVKSVLLHGMEFEDDNGVCFPFPKLG